MNLAKIKMHMVGDALRSAKGTDMIELDLTDHEAYNIVAVMDEREDKVRLAASLGDPFPAWAEDVEPIQRTFLRLYYQDQRQRERLGRGTAPF